MSDETIHTLGLLVAYRGAAFAGFARQPQPELITVQGELERALEMLFHRAVEITCAGRTDAGVHARGQVVSFDVSEDELSETNFCRLKRSLNAITHEDIVVKDVSQRASGFSARFNAVAREYRYFLAVGEVPPVFMHDYAWFVPGSREGLDVAAMERASRCLIGEQDFKSFCRASSAVGKPTCRNLMEVSFHTECIMGDELIMVKVVGSSFLHSMVRSIVGTLVEVGKGRRPERWVADALEAKDRTAAGECAPAQGLVFWDVRYER